MFRMQKHHWTLWLFVTLTLVGLVLYYWVGPRSAIWSFWSAVDVSFAVALGVLAFFAYREMVRGEDEVRLFFDVEGLPEPVDTGLSLLRRDCSRGEVIGVLGMMQRRTEQRFVYDPAHLGELLQEINRVQKGKEERLLIPISQKEFEQFALSKERR